MSRRTQQRPRTTSKGSADPVLVYLAALETAYPASKGKARVLARQDNRIVVSVPLPTRAQERMRLFDRMAEVGTRLLIETDQYIILSAQ
jgi:hypothetical protein